MYMRHRHYIFFVDILLCACECFSFLYFMIYSTIFMYILKWQIEWVSFDNTGCEWYFFLHSTRNDNNLIKWCHILGPSAILTTSITLYFWSVGEFQFNSNLHHHKCSILTLLFIFIFFSRADQKHLTFKSSDIAPELKQLNRRSYLKFRAHQTGLLPR